MVVARVEIDFMKPILYGQQVGIWTRISMIKRRSFVFDSVIGIEKGEVFTPAARAMQVIVYIDPVEQKSTLLPDRIISEIVKFEPQALDR